MINKKLQEYFEERKMRHFKKHHTFILWVIVIAVLLGAGIADTKVVHSVAILPFSMYDIDNKAYLQQVIGEALFYSLEKDGGFSIVSEDKIDDTLNNLKLKDFSMSNIYLLGRQMNSDYVIYGTVNKIGYNLSIFAEVIDIKGYRSQYSVNAVCHSIDDVRLMMNDFSRKIDKIIDESK
jgi:TolB-like protein